MTDQIVSKVDLREVARKRRGSLSSKDRSTAAIALGKQIAWQVAEKTVAGYYAIGNELDPSPLLNRLRAQNAEICLPVLIDESTMVFRHWEKDSRLEPAGFGTLGPAKNSPVVEPELILLPLLAFTPTGQRIGYGKGHYDRAIGKLHRQGSRPVLIGLAFDEQEVPDFPPEVHDISLDAVLTPSGLRRFTKQSVELDATILEPVSV
ncbi:MAG: 5-formyltetrahydrofolate cyclo-ligase [Pseudomonadota bacterium]